VICDFAANLFSDAHWCRPGASREARQYASEVQDLYEHAPCGYHSLDSDGRVVRINRTELE